MNNVVIERNTISTDVCAVLIFILSILIFCFTFNPAVIVTVFLAIFCYWIGRSKPLEYFWANNSGLEFHTGKDSVTLIPWSNVEKVILDSVYNVNLSSKNSRIEIQLNIKLVKPAIYIDDSGFFKTNLYLYEGKNNRNIFKSLTALKERDGNN